jgi:hypothetical protein
MGIAGDADFAYSILDYLFLNKDFITTSTILFQNLHHAATNISPSNRAFGTIAEILFCSNTLLIARSKFEVIYNGEIQVTIESNTVSPAQAFQIVIGSGSQYVRNHQPLEIGRSCSNDPSLLSVATQMLCMDYSRVLREGTQNQALTVGGAFLGFKIDRQNIHIPRDTLYFSLNQNGVATYITKIAYVNGLYIITDFLRRSINVVRTIDSELQHRANPPSNSIDISETLIHACSFQAPVNFISAYQYATDLHPNISVVESTTESAITNAPPTGFSWIDPNQEMVLTFSNGQSLTVIIP